MDGLTVKTDETAAGEDAKITGKGGSTTLFSRIKLMGRYAQIIDRECEERRVSRPSLIADYTMRGVDAAHAPDGAPLDAFERRLSATMLSVRGDVEALTAELDALFALVDALAKQLLAHLPEPSKDEAAGIGASALARYEKLITAAARQGFDAGRPRAVKRIAELLDKGADA